MSERPAVPHLGLLPLGQRRNLREHVLEALRSALIAAELAPGTVYSVPALANLFGVSPTPVREAMLDLAAQGLVVPVPNKGFRVTALSDRELDELTEIRALIEPPMVARVASTADRPDVEALFPAARAIIAAADKGDLIGFIDADLHFHLSLLALAGNEQMVEVVRSLRLRSRLYDLPQMAERGEVSECAMGHLDLLEAVLTGNPELAEQAMLDHLSQVRGVWAGRSSDRERDRLDAVRSPS